MCFKKLLIWISGLTGSHSWIIIHYIYIYIFFSLFFKIVAALGSGNSFLKSGSVLMSEAFLDDSAVKLAVSF